MVAVVVVVVARRGGDVFIGLSKKEVPAAVADPPQSLSHSLFPWQSFRRHHRQAVCKDPYNLFFHQPPL